MKINLFTIILIFFIAFPIYGEMEKTAIPCENKICFYWWPILPKIDGWHQDKEFCYKFKANTQAPDNFTFGNAETVIYAKALYKPRIPETKTLEGLISNDIKEFNTHEPNLIITKVESLVTSDGKVLVTYTFFPEEKGNWEKVAYGEEGEYYLIFTLSSRSKAGFNSNLSVFKKFIENYKENP